METQDEGDRMDSISLDASLQGTQDPRCVDTAVQMPTSTEPSTVSTVQFIPLVTVTQGTISAGHVSDVITTQAELCNDSMSSISQLHSLSPLQSSDLVVPSKDSSIAATSAALLTSSEALQPSPNVAQIAKVGESEPQLPPSLNSLVVPDDNPETLVLATDNTDSLELPAATPDSLTLPAANPSNLLEEAGRIIRKDCEGNDDADFTNCWDESVDDGATALSTVDDQEYPESFTEGWSVLFKKKFNPYFGYVNSLSEAEELLHTFQMCTESHFVSIKRCNKTSFQIDTSKGRPFRYTPIVIHGNKVPLDSVPYYHGGKAMYHCHLGSKRKEPPKDRPLKNPNEREHSKKVGCKAQIVFRVIALFPEHKLKSNTEHHRLMASQRLSNLFMEGGTDIPVEWRVYILLPKRSAHTNHDLVRTLRLRDRPLDRRLIGRICQLVQIGLTNTHTIQKHVVHFAENILTNEGMRWKSRKDICGSRQVWWYRKQVQDLMTTGKLEMSKFQDMINEVEDISQKYNYRGFIEDEESESEDDDSPRGRWKRRTENKNRQSYGKQLANVKSECFAELQQFVLNVQACTQVEVLARMLNNLRTFRQVFERESTAPWTEHTLGCKQEGNQANNIIQLFTVDSTQDINQLVQLHVANVNANNAQ